jgi:ANTAR domain
VAVESAGPSLAATERGNRLTDISAQMAANRARTEQLQQWTKHVLAAAQAAHRTSAEARRQRWSSPAGRDLMQQSAHARLLAQLESMPVIEQAKGIIMAQSHCGHAQAFDLLRRASQRSNVPVRDLAAQIVAKTAQVSPKRGRQVSRGSKVA